MKGIALPVNIIIILLIALIVLGVASVFVMTQVSTGETKSEKTYDYYTLCAAWQNSDCNQTNAPSGMVNACQNAGMGNTAATCAKVCCG